MSSPRGTVAGLSAFLILALCGAPPCAAQATVLASTTAIRITTDSGNGRAPIVTGMRTVRSGARSRTELFHGSEMSTPRTIMIVDTVEKTLLSVTPARHTAMLIAYPGESMKAVREAIPMKLVGKPEVHTEEVGDGPVILGHPTRHYHTSFHSVMHYAGPQVSCDRITDTRAEIWATRDSMGPSQPPAVSPIASAIPELASEAMKSQHVIQGETLRSERVTRLDRGDGAPVEIKVTGEIVQLDYGPVDSSLFAAPAGYEVVDQRELMAMVDQKKMLEAVSPFIGANLCGKVGGKKP